ncbi:ATP-binding protein|uniref:Histidine kinase-like ATPase domain-containing protein n=1 Tax=Dendrosporobacter quercicolus TaxID=146817 RepID=A0A1G9TJV1_9FIRM|nr:ATP-binding protein [Dendrosporobacter quercicolus]NSL48936.1 ATP-binding protein [Dendrosporobacter quercicolus DSM 1736]SDM48017.1 Histidine kinase-like ATPase domain-containing protein [Dendrosporobacter quercicolus]
MHRLQVSFRGQEGYRVIRHCVNEYIKQTLGSKCAAMVIAFNEAVNNAIQYGGRSGAGTVTVKFRLLKGKRLIIRVKDSGAGFAAAGAYCQAAKAPLRFEDIAWSESGRGVFLMKAIADYVIYNKCGNEVLLMKRVPGETG